MPWKSKKWQGIVPIRCNAILSFFFACSTLLPLFFCTPPLQNCPQLSFFTSYPPSLPLPLPNPFTFFSPLASVGIILTAGRSRQARKPVVVFPLPRGWSPGLSKEAQCLTLERRLGSGRQLCCYAWENRKDDQSSGGSSSQTVGCTYI